MLKEKILTLLKKNKSKKEIANELNTSLRYVNMVNQQNKTSYKIEKLTKTIQLLRDELRIERRIKRKDIRSINSIEKYLSEISKHISSYKIPKLKTYDFKRRKFEGIFQLSDLHFNEIVSDLEENKYDFYIASKRLKKYTLEAVKIFKIYNVSDVLIAMTGDILGSNRREDEKLNLATNRAKAVIIGTFLIENVIRELNEFFNIKITMVCGNESRSYDVGESDIIMSDNYDFILYNMLKMIFSKNLDMFIDGDVYKKILKIQNRNILFFHGHNLNNNPELQIEKIIGQVAVSNRISLDYVIFGHIHECQISDFFARSSSLIGGNTYTSNKLNLISKASQNIHLISENSIYSFKIDLQNTDDIIGYDLNSDFQIHKNNKNQNTFLNIS